MNFGNTWRWQTPTTRYSVNSTALMNWHREKQQTEVIDLRFRLTYPTQIHPIFTTQIRTLSTPWLYLSCYDTLTNLT